MVICPSKIKNGVDLLTQSAENRICMGKWGLQSEAILFLSLQKGPRHSDFSGDRFATNILPKKIEHEQTRRQGGGAEK